MLIQHRLVLLFVIFTSGAVVAQTGTDVVYVPDPGNNRVTYMESRGIGGIVLLSGRLTDGKKDGVFKTYNGQQQLISVQEFHNDLADGVKLVFGDNLSIELEENYRGGLLHGRRISWRFGGIRKSEEYYKEGKLDSIKTVFYDSGFRQEVAHYKEDARHGLSQWFNQGEQLSIEYNYHMGKLQGRARIFHTNSTLEQEGFYADDEQEGEWNYFDAAGKKIKTVHFSKGRVIREITH